jgi:hypothetical protein
MLRLLKFRAAGFFQIWPLSLETSLLCTMGVTKEPIWDLLCLAPRQLIPPFVPCLGKGVPAQANLPYQSFSITPFPVFFSFLFFRLSDLVF